MPSATYAPFPDSSYQFAASVDAVNCVSRGTFYEYNFADGVTWMINLTPLGLLTRGLAYGLGDFWHYYDLNTQQTIGWTMVMP